MLIILAKFLVSKSVVKQFLSTPHWYLFYKYIVNKKYLMSEKKPSVSCRIIYYRVLFFKKRKPLSNCWSFFLLQISDQDDDDISNHLLTLNNQTNGQSYKIMPTSVWGKMSHRPRLSQKDPDYPRKKREIHRERCRIRRAVLKLDPVKYEEHKRKERERKRRKKLCDFFLE